VNDAIFKTVVKLSKDAKKSLSDRLETGTNNFSMKISINTNDVVHDTPPPDGTLTL